MDEAAAGIRFFVGDAQVVRDERAIRVAPQNTTENSKHHRDSVFSKASARTPLCRHRKRAHGRPQGSDHRHLTDDSSQVEPTNTLVKEETQSDGGESATSASHPLFTEMCELASGAGGQHWRQIARWVKFEEEVEGSNRWSKPHVSTLSLHAVFELRYCLLNGVVCFDLKADDFSHIVDALLDAWISGEQLERADRDEVRSTLLQRHTHQYCRGHMSKDQSYSSGAGGRFLSTVRSMAEIGRTLSHNRIDRPQSMGDAPDRFSNSSPECAVSLLGGLTGIDADERRVETTYNTLFSSRDRTVSLPKAGSIPQALSCQTISHTEYTAKGNLHFMKKLPSGVEASNVLIGELDQVQSLTTAVVRLDNAVSLGDLTEVPVPTRFVIVLLGPRGDAERCRQMGRAIATLLADEVFRDVAYSARTRQELLDGVDEFLDQVTVLPPGEWDSNMRIEPPATAPPVRRKPTDSPLNKHSTFSPLHVDDDADKAPMRPTGRLFGGLRLDILRKAPSYLSDYRDALNMKCLATILFMYFAVLAPIVTFGGLLGEATEKQMAAMENLFSAAICGITFHLFAGQPLIIIGSTGPVLLFEAIIFNMCKWLDLDFMSFRLWVNLWTGGILLVLVATDASAFISYVTRFTEESFAMLIALIFIFEAAKKLVIILRQSDVIALAPGACECRGNGTASTGLLDKLARRGAVNASAEWVGWARVPLRHCERLGGELAGDGCYRMLDVFLMSLVLTVGTFALVSALKALRNSNYFPTWIRRSLSDFSVMIAIVAMVGVDALCGIDTPKLNVPSTFRPTSAKRDGWLVAPFNGNPWWTAPLALIPSLLACILKFMDQQITAVIVNRKENGLRKGYGYHLDLLIIALLVVVVGVLGLPVYVAATVLSINHVNSLRVASDTRAPGETATFIGVCENRVTGVVTFVLIGASVMLTRVLVIIPMPVLYGVFLYMGVSAFDGIQFFDRLTLLLMPMKYQPDYIYLRHVPIRRVHLFTAFQATCLALLWTINSFDITAIAFPVMARPLARVRRQPRVQLVVMVCVRKAMERLFRDDELKYMDDLIPENSLRRREDDKVSVAFGWRRRDGVQKTADSSDLGSGVCRAVTTMAHLHVPMASGNVLKIPLPAEPAQVASLHNSSHT